MRFAGKENLIVAIGSLSVAEAVNRGSLTPFVGCNSFKSDRIIYDVIILVTAAGVLSTCFPLSDNLPRRALGPVGGLFAVTELGPTCALCAFTWPFIEGLFLMPLDSPIGGLTLYIPFVKLRGPVGIFLVGDAGAEGDGCDDVDAGLV